MAKTLKVTNLYAAPSEQPEPPDEYLFTDRERLFFEQPIKDLNIVTFRLQQATGLICTQQGLEGSWQIKPDGSGLIKVGSVTGSRP